MKHAILITTAFATFLLASAAAPAQERGAGDRAGSKHEWSRGGGHREWNRGGDWRDWNRGGRYGYDRYYPGGRGWAGPRYYPYSVYVSPYFVAPYISVPLYEPPPVYVERFYVEEAPPPPVQRSYSERSYAQIVPPQPSEPPRPLAPPAPRFERITLSAQELFGFDQARLRTPQPKLDEFAAVMNRNPQVGNVRITGYTDRIGTDAYNMKLSQRRADAVKSYLVAKRVAASRLTAVGKGEANPVVQCNDKRMADLIKCLEPNRRVEVEQITVERRIS